MKDRKGTLLNQAKNACLTAILKRMHREGFWGLGWSSKHEEHPSPLPGSVIVIGDLHEVVLVLQTKKGGGPIEVLTYTVGPIGVLGLEVKTILDQSGIQDPKWAKLYSKDGHLQNLAQTSVEGIDCSGCLSKLFNSMHQRGFRGRPNGKTSKDGRSETPGSKIIMGNRAEVALVYDTYSVPPLGVVSYHQNIPGRLGMETIGLLSEAGFLQNLSK